METFDGISVRRKEDKVQIVNSNNSPLASMDAETAIKFSHDVLFHADKILKADHVIDDG